MTDYRPDFIKDADNVYRTRHYIVKQKIRVNIDSSNDIDMCSYDTYYFRTRQRDAEYVLVFSNRKNINGKRLPSTMYSRIYVE